MKKIKIKKIGLEELLLFLILCVLSLATFGFETYVARIPFQTVLAMKFLVIFINAMTARYYGPVRAYFIAKPWKSWWIETASSLVVLGGGYILKLAVSLLLGIFFPIYHLTKENLVIGILGTLLAVVLFAAEYQKFISWLKKKLSRLSKVP